MKKRMMYPLLVLLIGSMTFIACKDDSSENKMNPDPMEENEGSELYQRLGGNAGIKTVVDDFIGIVVGDDRINGFFAATAQSQERVDALKMNLVNQIGEAVGGPEVYTGLSMKAAHEGMGIQDADFDALVEDLVMALKNAGVSQADIDTIAGVLLPMRADIVEE